MLRQHAAFPRAIAEELPPQRVDRLPPEIARADIWREINAATCAANAVVQFVVFVDGERLVKTPRSVEDIARPGAHVNGVDKLRLLADGKPAGHAERRAIRGSDRPTQRCSRLEPLRPTDV